jgi:hypothetical protein
MAPTMPGPGSAGLFASLRSAARLAQESFLVGLADAGERARVVAALSAEGVVAELPSAEQALDRLAEEPMDRALAASGLLVVAVDLTLSGEAPYPACVQDANYAVRWLKANAVAWNGDPSRIGVYGSSSGGHVAELLAMRPRDPRYASIPLAAAPDVDAAERDDRREQRVDLRKGDHIAGDGVEAVVVYRDRLELVSPALAFDEGLGGALRSPDYDRIRCNASHLDANREAVGLVDDCIHECAPSKRSGAVNPKHRPYFNAGLIHNFNPI